MNDPGPITIVGMAVVVVATGVILAGSRRRDRVQATTQTYEEPETPAPAG